MRQKGQMLLFSDVELNVLKGAFADNEDLLFAVRKVLLQFELNDVEKTLIRSFITEPVYNVVKKRLLTEIDPELPLGQLSNLVFTIQEKMKSTPVEDMAPVFDALQLEKEYLEQQFKVLKDIDGRNVTKIFLNELPILKGKDAYNRYVDLTAFTFITSYVDTMLIHIRTLAGKKEETMEELKKRIQRDSAK